MKTYAVRKALRTPVHCQFYFYSNGTLINGIVWDLSEAGLRVTVDRPVPVGLERPSLLPLVMERTAVTSSSILPLLAGLRRVTQDGKLGVSIN